MIMMMVMLMVVMMNVMLVTHDDDFGSDTRKLQSPYVLPVSEGNFPCAYINPVLYRCCHFNVRDRSPIIIRKKKYYMGPHKK